MTYPHSVHLRLPDFDPPLTLYIHGYEDEFVSRDLREQGVWEPYETRLVMDFLGQDDVFVDVGANLGYFTMIAAARVGKSGQVIAFEPDPENYQRLQASCQVNGLQAQVEAVKAGLSDTDSAGQLYLSENNLGDHQVYAGSEARHSLPITLYQGADFLQSRLKKIDLLKVDTQGSEYAVMSGLLPLLMTFSEPLKIMIELTPYSLRQAGSSGRQLIELLAKLDLPFWIIDHIEHRLVASSEADLALWCDNVDACENDQGFMNILIGALEP